MSVITSDFYCLNQLIVHLKFYLKVYNILLRIPLILLSEKLSMVPSIIELLFFALFNLEITFPTCLNNYRDNPTLTPDINIWNTVDVMDMSNVFSRFTSVNPNIHY